MRLRTGWWTSTTDGAEYVYVTAEGWQQKRDPTRCPLCRTNGHEDLPAHLVSEHGWAPPGSVFLTNLGE